MMSHTGRKEGTYPGTRASATMIVDDENKWGTKSLAILYMQFTSVIYTLLRPWDVFRKDSSVLSRVEKSEANAQATNGTKSLAILYMQFTSVIYTLLRPWDVFRKDSSVLSRVEKSEANAQATNAVIPPARMPDN